MAEPNARSGLRQTATAASARATLGVFEWPGPDEALVNQHIFRVVPELEKVETRFLRHLLENSLSEMQRHLHGATMQHINRDEFLSTRVYLPALDEQRRIAGLLDKANTLRATRRRALAKVEALSRSMFLDMFGDPAVNRWPMTRVEAVAEDAAGSIRTGPFGRQLLHSEFADEGIAVLGIDNAVHNEFRWGELRFISEPKYAACAAIPSRRETS